MKYKPEFVVDYFKECGIPEPMVEHKFHDTRKWRFDFAWDYFPQGSLVRTKLALEVQGGIFVRGAHARGGYIKKEHEKRNAAAALGWRIIYVVPDDLCMQETADLIRQCLNL